MDDELPNPSNVVRLAVLFEGGMVLVALALGWLVGQPPLADSPLDISAVAWGAAGSLPMLLVLVVCIRARRGPLARLTRTVDELIVPLFQRCTLVEMALICALAGLGEEMLFRGVLQAALSRWTCNPTLGLALAAVLFGLAHSITPTYAALATAIGVYLSWLWQSTGNLWSPITAHALYDFLAMVYLVRIRSPARTTSLSH